MQKIAFVLICNVLLNSFSRFFAKRLQKMLFYLNIHVLILEPSSYVIKSKQFAPERRTVMVKTNVFARFVENMEGGYDIVVLLSPDFEKIYRSVFIDRGAAAAFVERVNRMGVSPLHIDDVIEDSLP